MSYFVKLPKKNALQHNNTSIKVHTDVSFTYLQKSVEKAETGS